jgi:hypothetical protein
VEHAFGWRFQRFGKCILLDGGLQPKGRVSFSPSFVQKEDEGDQEEELSEPDTSFT